MSTPFSDITPAQWFTLIRGWIRETLPPAVKMLPYLQRNADSIWSGRAARVAHHYRTVQAKAGTFIRPVEGWLHGEPERKEFARGLNDLRRLEALASEIASYADLLSRTAPDVPETGKPPPTIWCLPILLRDLKAFLLDYKDQQRRLRDLVDDGLPLATNADLEAIHDSQAEHAALLDTYSRFIRRWRKEARTIKQRKRLAEAANLLRSLRRSNRAILALVGRSRPLTVENHPYTASRLRNA